jgi:hypothetical protein
MKNRKQKRTILRPSAVLLQFLLFPTMYTTSGQTQTGATVPLKSIKIEHATENILTFRASSLNHTKFVLKKTGKKSAFKRQIVGLWNWILNKELGLFCV